MSDFESFIIISFIGEETEAQKDCIPCTGQMASEVVENNGFSLQLGAGVS